MTLGNSIRKADGLGIMISLHITKPVTPRCQSAILGKLELKDYCGKRGLGDIKRCLR